MNDYEVIIGLEVHVELNTKTKMFCRCSADYFGQEPNSHTCPVCLGLPGALPVINQEAIDKCMQIGLALNCSVQETSRFERKNYFYPDLAKGFQTSQLRWPLCVNGWLDVKNSQGEVKRIRINRAHQEEDTGKLQHQVSVTVIDYNRCSVPLVEIVTEPDFRDIAEVKDYAKKLQQLFRYLGVSNADMERGDMRLEANISVRKKGQTELPPYRVELKNINSFRFMGLAVEYEIKRQIEAHESGEKLYQETRGWNESKQKTFVQRSKEEANDYRYFPEPDLPPLKISAEKVEKIRGELPELPWEKKQRFIEEFKLTENDAEILAGDKEISDIFENDYVKGTDQLTAKELANYLINRKVDLLTANSKEIIELLVSNKSNKVGDEDTLSALAQEVINENPAGAVDSYKAGKVAAIGVLIGSLMKKTQGKADPAVAKQVIEKLLK